MESQAQGFEGLFVPMVTPMDSEGNLDPAGIAALAKHLADAPGVAGLVTGARIGEGPVLTFEEHVSLTRSVSQAVDVPVIASILPRSAAEGAAQTVELKKAGAVAVMVFPPLLLAWGKVPEEVKYEFFVDLDRQTALPIVLFQVPLSNYWFSPETAARIAGLEQVVSMKEASFDMARYGATIDAVRDSGNSMTILNGNDRFVAEGAIMGAEGALIGIANLVPEAWAETIRLGAGGSPAEALELQRRLRPLQELIFREPILDAVGRMKAVLKDEGVIGDAHVRRPQMGVHGKELEEVLAGYAEVRDSLRETAPAGS